MKDIVFNRNDILLSIGRKLSILFDKKVYIEPNPQLEVKLPCFFVQYMPNSSEYLKPEVGKNYYCYNFDIDITYLQNAQDINTYIKANTILDILDTEFSDIQLYNESGEIIGSLGVLRPKNSWTLNDLHYQFSLTFRVHKKLDENVPKLKDVVINVSLKGDKNGN